MNAPPPGTTVTLPPPDPRVATFTRTTPVGSGFEEELRQLLRYRLILVHLLGLFFAILLFVLSHFSPEGAQQQDIALRPDAGTPWRLIPTFAQSLIGAVVLWKLPGMSLRSLRVWEVVHFATHAAYYGEFRFEMLAHRGGENPNMLGLAYGFRGVVSLIGFVTLILAYGVLIPNTRRRSLAGVAVLMAIPFVALAAAAIDNPILRSNHGVFRLFVQALTVLTFPAAIAVFAAARASALQRRAYEAERRAEQIGQYTLQRRLGEGGMGEVWLAEHRLMKRPCAVKFIRPELAANPVTAARFVREVQAVTGLTHFNTVRVYDYGRADDGSFYYVMEYLEGPTLEALVKRAGPLEPGRAVYLLRQLCGALAEAHAAGLVHRDIKPGNVIVAALGGQHDVAKLLDFGLVQDLSTLDAGERLTQAGVVMGTPAYMCPEQASGSNAVDARGDIYSLGAVAFFMLTGRPPFERATVGEHLLAHLTQTPPGLQDVRLDTPADLAVIVAKCLTKEPADRFQSATELEAALAACTCRSDWSAALAAAWWTGDGRAATPTSTVPTATFHQPEPTPT